MNAEEIKLRKLLYRAVRELSYIQCVELEGDHSLCATPEGNSIVEEGMKLLGVNDLSVDSYRWHPADCKHVWLRIGWIKAR